MIFLKVLAIIFCFVGCYSVERNCEQFRKGTFSYSTLIDHHIQTSIFIRDSLYEIELYDQVVDSSSIRWVNDCEFVLTKLNPIEYNDRKPIRIKILTTSLNQYTFEFSQVGDNKNVVRGVVTKISDSINSKDLFENHL
ncbi:MAG: hypothetical protein OXE77_06320 [Flavobacteriaceae bacterium]|nr:hypothetical protein [Flavobacteriaceae bacterium]